MVLRSRPSQMRIRIFNPPLVRKSVTNTRAPRSHSYDHTHGHNQGHGHDQRQDHNHSHSQGLFATSFCFPARVLRTLGPCRHMEWPQVQLLRTLMSNKKQSEVMRSTQRRGRSD